MHIGRHVLFILVRFKCELEILRQVFFSKNVEI